MNNETKDEIWKTWPEAWYVQGSNLGRVRTLDRTVQTKHGLRLVQGRVLKQQCNRGNYLFVNFRLNGKQVNRLVHRIIAEAFIPNPDNLPQVNHKDCNRKNNNVLNLEWCDNSYNVRYREKYGVSQTETLGHPVYVINLKTQESLRFESQSEAGRELGVNVGHINSVIKGRRNQAGSYWFTYVDNNAIETTRNKFGNEVANKVAELMKKHQ